MNIPREKRTPLALVIAGTLLLLALIGLGLIRPQYQSLATIAGNIKSTGEKLKQVKETVKKSDQTAAELANATYNLDHAEDDIASGDVYAWTYDTIRRFKQSYRVDIPSVSQPSMSQVDLLPAFPYKQLKVNINGTAYFHDLGKFIADLENNFPHVRLVNLSLEPAMNTGGDNQKLNFRMDVVALVKNNP